MQIIDLNAAAGNWPIQYLGANSLEALDDDYALLGIHEVWLSAIEAILAPEPDLADRSLFQRLSGFPRFRPVKTVNPLLGNWRTSLQAFHAEFPLAAVKLFPNYHGYPLDHPEIHALCEELERLELPLLIQIRVNDERNQPVCLEVEGVAADAIAALSQEHSSLPIVALSAYAAELAPLRKGSSRLMADISFVDGISTLERAVRSLPVSQIVFGSAAAWMVPHAAVLKLEHSGLAPEMIEAIASQNVLTFSSAKSHV